MPFPPINPFFDETEMDGTEQDLNSKQETQVKHYQVMVGYNELVGGGESLQIKIYCHLLDDVERLVEVVTVTGATVPKIYKTYLSAKKIRVTGTQTGGTFRDIQCELHQI